CLVAPDRWSRRRRAAPGCVGRWIMTTNGRHPQGTGAATRGGCTHLEQWASGGARPLVAAAARSAGYVGQWIVTTNGRHPQRRSSPTKVVVTHKEGGHLQEAG